ncbi:MAG: hypothetical protein ACO3CS_15390, partial [Alphaproteobacteria bacterium]
MRPSFARHAIAGLAVALLLGILPASTARAQACAGLPAARASPAGPGGCRARVPVAGPARAAAPAAARP